MKRWLFFILFIALTGCGAPDAATPAPTPEAIDVYYPASLQPWADRLSACANDNPLVGLYSFPAVQPGTEIKPNQIVLTLSPSSHEFSVASYFQVGKEQIAVIVNQSNPLSRLSTSELRSIFSGQEKNWQNSADQPIEVWVPPQGDELRSIFDRTVMQSLPVTSEAMLAPDPAAMLEAISKNPKAIGYLPASFLNSSGTTDPGAVNIVQIDSRLETELSLPVVAITADEPQGNLRKLLVCLESSTP